MYELKAFQWLKDYIYINQSTLLHPNKSEINYMYRTKLNFIVLPEV